MAKTITPGRSDRRIGELLATTAAVSLLLIAFAVRELLQLR
jgi:hypothetical protein